MVKNKRVVITIVLVIFLAAGYFAYKYFLHPIKWTTEQIRQELHAGKIDPEFQKYFDRDPERHVPDQKNIIVSPADGIVKSINSDDSGYTIIISLSLFDVHVQRIPISGKVLSIKQLGSEFFSGKDPKYLDGVQTVTTIGTTLGDVAVKQITALFTTRIKTYPKEGDQVQIGERLGRILLGSTVVIVLPKTVKLEVSENQVVTGAETIIAKY